MIYGDEVKEKKLYLRIPIYLLGSIIGGCGSALVMLNRLGNNAMGTCFNAIAVKLGILPGLVYTCFNSFNLIIGFLFAREYMGIGSIFQILVQGYLMNAWIRFLSNAIPFAFTVPIYKALVAIASILITWIGQSLSFSMCLGTAGFEACLHAIAGKIMVEYKYLKTFTELFFFITGYFLDGVFGPLTIVEVFFFGFGMSYFTELLNRTLWKQLGIDDERNELSRNRRRVKA